MRIAAQIEYDGTAYCGWQWQRDLPTVQIVVEHAFSKVADSPIKIICAGRTDAGVHAAGQIIHFDTDIERSERAWVFGANANLPYDVVVRWAKVVDETFHARFSAIARRYRYCIYNHSIRSALKRQQTTWECRPLNANLMHQAAQKLVGEHDFNSFRAKACQAKSPVRTIELLNVTREDDLIYIDIQANAFLHHMVRNIAGVLIAIGCGEADSKWIDELLKLKNRADGGVTAPATGLCLLNVIYPANFSI